jgi:group I intron endonuclease
LEDYPVFQSSRYSQSIIELTPYSGIYLIRNSANGKSYVGSSQSIGRRLCIHIRTLRGNYHKNKHLQSAWNLHGEDAFEFLALEIVSDDDLVSREQFWIDEFQVFNAAFGYNTKPNADGSVMPEETRRKISQSKTGVPMRPEARAKLSASRKGTGLSEAHHEKLQEGACRSPRRRKQWLIEFPDGAEAVVGNLNAFCREHGLSQGLMNQVAHGQRRQHKGYRCTLLSAHPD